MFPPFWEKCGRFFEIVFYPRIKTPLGMTRLAGGTGAYVCGGTIYRKSADNKWENMTIFFENISVQSNNSPKGVQEDSVMKKTSKIGEKNGK